MRLKLSVFIVYYFNSEKVVQHLILDIVFISHLVHSAWCLVRILPERASFSHPATQSLVKEHSWGCSSVVSSSHLKHFQFRNLSAVIQVRNMWIQRNIGPLGIRFISLGALGLERVASGTKCLPKQDKTEAPCTLLSTEINKVKEQALRNEHNVRQQSWSADLAVINMSPCSQAGVQCIT